jgi:hypothetical protein
MRKWFLAFFLSALWVMVLLPRVCGQETGRIPPGLRQANEANQRANAPLAPSTTTPSTASKPRKADPAQLEREARELAELSAQISKQIAAVNQGQFPKDLTDQLKQIEKLAKRLRSEVMP